jgi:cytochrome c biogenesis protein CcmG/thiol:disulfide interchange protein DsbE
MQAAMVASSLRAGTMTDTTGRAEAVSVAGIRRIHYYSWVRRIFCFTRVAGAVALALLIIILLATLALSGCWSGTRPSRIGSAAPDFTVRDSERTVTLSQLKGQVVVLNFWATWCPPCIEEMPSLVQMQQRMKAKGVTVLAVSVDADEKQYRRFLRDHNVSLLSVRDADQKSNELYGTFKFPETYVIDRNGVVRRKFIGAVDWTEPEVIDFLGKL